MYMAADVVIVRIGRCPLGILSYLPYATISCTLSSRQPETRHIIPLSHTVARISCIIVVVFIGVPNRENFTDGNRTHDVWV